MNDRTRKLPTTGYWIFVCNTAVWNADQWLELNESEIAYRISKHHRQDFQPGQLGVLRVNDDRRSNATRGDRPKLQAGIYAIFRVIEKPFFSEDPDPRFLNDPEAAGLRWRARVEVVANLLSRPILADSLPDTADYQYIHRPLQTSSIPLSSHAFETISAMAGVASAGGTPIVETSPLERITVPDDVYRQIAVRRGQPEFRSKLLKLFDGSCGITGCRAVEALEAAHVVPYAHRRRDRDSVSNGLLLRADIHTLFDLHLISIEPTSHKVSVAHQIRHLEPYAVLHKRRSDTGQASEESLQDHFAKHVEKYSGEDTEETLP